MNILKKTAMGLAVATILIISAHGQGFLNLNFESAQNLTMTNDAYIPVSSALPGWTAYDSDVAYSDVYYASNNFPGYYTVVELVGGSLALSGDFSVAMISGSISQAGTVPNDAESLQFEASFGAPNLQVSLGGQKLSYSAISQGPGYYIYGANIPAAMVGQTEALTFGFSGPGQTVLDNIQFSTMSVPEPAEWAVIGLGAVSFGYWRRKRAKTIHLATD